MIQTKASTIITIVAVIICLKFLTLKGPIVNILPESAMQHQDKELTLTENSYQGRMQDDQALIRYIRTLLVPPSTKPYNLRNPKRKHFTTMDQSPFLGELYGPGKRDGFFVEVGAYTGEEASDTLYLERELGFTGLLIEPNDKNYQELYHKNRRAYLLHAALSPTTSSAELLFSGKDMLGHILESFSASAIKIKAFPLFSTLMAVNATFIDVCNIDIQGHEFQVVKTIPFDKVKFGILIIEFFEIPEPKEELLAFMENKGYQKIHENRLDYFFGDPEYIKKLPGWIKRNSKS